MSENMKNITLFYLELSQINLVHIYIILIEMYRYAHGQ